MNAQIAQAFERNRESLACGDFDLPEVEVTDEHRRAATERFADADCVNDWFAGKMENDSTWSDKMLRHLLTENKEFLDVFETEHKTQLEQLACEIADNEATSRYRQAVDELFSDAFGVRS